jgi:hypothetical protein
VGGAAFHSIVIHVLDLNGSEVMRLHSSSGSVLWPGWTRVDNRMTLTNPAVRTLRLYADLTFGGAAVLGRNQLSANGVVSTGEVTVNYPDANLDCAATPTSEPVVAPIQIAAPAAPAPPAAAAAQSTPAQLPVTGFPTEIVVVAGLVLILAGVVLVVRARAERPLPS